MTITRRLSRAITVFLYFNFPGLDIQWRCIAKMHHTLLINPAINFCPDTSA